MKVEPRLDTFAHNQKNPNVISRRFRRKCTTHTVASFVRQFNTIGPLFCSFVQHHQLELRTSKTYSKRQNLIQNKNIDVQNLENIGSPLWCFSLGFFSAVRLLLKLFGFHQRVSPSFLKIFCNTMDVKKSQRVTPFTNFGTVTLFKNLDFKIFSNFFNVSKGSSFKFFEILQLTGVSQCSFTISSLRYSADFGR